MNNQPIRILGIDPGTNLTGWGIIDKYGPDITFVDYGCIETSKSLAMPARLAIIFDSLCDIINKSKPHEVAIEELFFFKNQKTIISVAQARGVAIVTAATRKLPVFEYTPLQVKQALTGYGRAEKHQVEAMVRLGCKLDHNPKPDDAADALAVAMCHAQTSRIVESAKV